MTRGLAGRRRTRPVLVVASLLAGCSKPFTDVTARKASPDGAVVASSVLSATGFGLYFGQGVTLAAKGADPLRAEPVLTYGEDDRPPQVSWIDADHLRIELPCGWWGGLTNHWQLAGTKRIVDIAYVPSRRPCPASPRRARAADGGGHPRFVSDSS